jgi:translation initiation factor IF-1
MAQKTDAELQIYADANINTNGTNSLTGALHNTMLTHMIDSKANNNDIGDRDYTEQNYVTDSESITASIDALDQALGGISGGIQSDSGILPSAAIKVMHDTPYDIVYGITSSQMIEIISVSAYINFNTTPYQNGGDIVYKYENAPVGQNICVISKNLLYSTADTYLRASFTSNVVMLPGEKVIMQMEDSNPTHGDSPIKFFVTYKILDL